MKVTFVTDTYAPQLNGVARTLERLVRGLRSRGHQVDVIRPAKLGVAEEGLEVRSIPMPGYDGLHLGIENKAGLISRWSAERPDVIYVATEAMLGVAAISAARALKIPVVSGFHTNFQQYFSYYNLPGLESLATFYLKVVHNRSLRTYVPCDDVRESLRKEGFDNLELLPKGVDTQLFKPERRDPELRKEWGAGSDDPVGIYVGRIAPEKNLPLAMQAFSRMRKRCPGFQAVLVGDGPKRAELERQHPDFLFVGPKYGEDLARYYASADIFVFPSMTETFGNVVMEAMASGLVTVAYDYAAPRQHIRHGINGFVAPFNDKREFLKCVDHALDRRHWDDVRAGARETAVAVSWERVIDDFQESLSELVESVRVRQESSVVHYT